MDWMQVLFLFFGNAALIGWLRADIKQSQAEMKDFHSTMKDFQGRLCTLEERYINWLMRDK